jgi:hypothetical protein
MTAEGTVGAPTCFARNFVQFLGKKITIVQLACDWSIEDLIVSSGHTTTAASPQGGRPIQQPIQEPRRNSETAA